MTDQQTSGKRGLISRILLIFLKGMGALFTIAATLYAIFVVLHFFPPLDKTVIWLANGNMFDLRESDRARGLIDSESVLRKVATCLSSSSRQITSNDIRSSLKETNAIDLGHNDELGQVLHLDASLLLERETFLRELRLSTSRYQIWQVIAIALGLLTTVTVSVSSTEPFKSDVRKTNWLRVLSILFPAMATANATASTLYVPSGSIGALTSVEFKLSELHGRFAMELWPMPCPSQTKSDLLKKSLASWQKELADIKREGAGLTTSPNK